MSRGPGSCWRRCFGVPVVFDAAIAGCSRVNISSGDLLFGLELAAADLIRLARARLAPLAEPPAG